jgi:hypothetical protein
VVSVELLPVLPVLRAPLALLDPLALLAPLDPLDPKATLAPRDQ